MYLNTSALSQAAGLRHERKLAMRIQSRLLSAMLAIGCFLLFAVSNSGAQQNNTINTVAGGAPPNPVATLAAIPNPTGVAEDASGNIYVASSFSYNVYKVNPVANTLAIFAGTGIAGFTGDGGLATSATLSAPVAVAVDNNSGSVYILDSNRVRCVLLAPGGCGGSPLPAGDIMTLAGNGALCSPNTDPCGDNGPYNGSKVRFYQPQGIYVDGHGNVFVSDTGAGRVRFLNTTGSTVIVAGIPVLAGNIATVAGNGLTCNGPTQACGDGFSSISPPAPPNNPSGARLDLAIGVATDSNGNIYIGDTRDQRIRCVVNVLGGCPQPTFPNAAVGTIVTYAGNTGVFCPVPTNSCNDGQTPFNARFHNPAGVWVDSAGNLYIADQWDYKIREVTTGPNAVVTTLVGTGKAAFGGDGGKARNAYLDGPLAVILDAAGTMTFADSGNGRIRQVSTSNLISTIAGGGSIGDGGPATSASLADPVSVAWDPSGTNYYISDSANNIIRCVVGTAGGCGGSSLPVGDITTVAGNGEPTYWQPLTNGDGGLAVLAQLTSPGGVATDAAGNLYIADSLDSLVRAVNMQGTPIVILGVTIQPGDIATVAGSGQSCENPTALCGDGALATSSAARITYPSSVSLDAQGDLYIADLYDNRIRCVLAVLGGCNGSSFAVGDLSTVAGTGVAGYSGDDGPGNQAQLHHPFSVAADPAGNVYIADSLNNRIRCVIGAVGGCGDTSKTKTVGTIVVYAFKDGKSSFGGDGGLALNASMKNPLVVALDPAGNVFVSAGADLLVRRIDALAQTIITVAGNSGKPGNAGFGGDGGASTKATLNNLGVSVNAAGYVLIADQGNDRVRQVDTVGVGSLPVTKLTFQPTTVGQTSTPQNAGVKNTGLNDVFVTNVAFGGADPGDFQIYNNQDNCMPQVAPQFTCSIAVAFKPTKTGTRTATLNITTNLGVGKVTLTGTGQ
jgi:trimeric autotransporter adhesin